jgi:hypothetical protein
MAVLIPGGFQVTNVDPIDSRFSVANQAARYALAPANIYPGLLVYQQDVRLTFLLVDTSNVANANGWMTMLTGGSSTSGSQTISGSLIVLGSITGSLFGTASYALTASFFSGSVSNAISASYALTASYVENAGSSFSISTGSIVASVNTDTSSIFLIQSASLPFLNISSNSNLTVNSDLFIVEGFTSQQPVLTVSGSIVNIATHSINPVGNTDAGNIYFTSGAMYIGLE